MWNNNCGPTWTFCSSDIQPPCIMLKSGKESDWTDKTGISINNNLPLIQYLNASSSSRSSAQLYPSRYARPVHPCRSLEIWKDRTRFVEKISLTKAAWSQKRLSVFSCLLLALERINMYYKHLITENDGKNYLEYLQTRLHSPQQAKASGRSSDQIRCTQEAHWKNQEQFLCTCHRTLQKEKKS